MADSEKRLGITLEDVKRMMGNSVKEKTDPWKYFEDVYDRLEAEQPELAGFLAKASTLLAHGPTAFPMGVAFTYDSLPETLTKEPLTTEQIDATYKTSTDYVIQAGGKHFAVMDWFEEVVNKDSPEFVDWFAEMAQEFDTDILNNDFKWGVLLVLLAFYQRSDSRILAKKLGY